MTFLILPQSLVTCNQYYGKPAKKTTICNVPWPLFYRAMCPWPCSARSMGKCGGAILSPELGATAELGRDWDPAAAASHEGHAIPPVRGKATCFCTPAGCSVRQSLRDPNVHRKQTPHPWTGRCLPGTEVRAVLRLLLLLKQAQLSPLAWSSSRAAARHLQWKWLCDSAEQNEQSVPTLL